MAKRTDANDILKETGPEGLRAASDNAKTFGPEDLGGGEPNGANGAIGNGNAGNWEEPDLSLLEGPAIPAPAFPLALLGPYWGPWCAAAAKGANAPVDYTATALLTTAAAMIGNARVVAATPTWEEAIVLWGMLIGVPSAGKSPALDPLMRIVSGFDADLARDFEQTRLTHVADQEVAAQKKENWKAAMKSAVKAGKDAPPLPADALELPPPQRPRIMISDTTMEAAAEIAAANPKGLLLSRDELGGWWLGFNRYGGDGERQFWIEAYGARPRTVDRKKLGRPIIVPRLSISVLGGTQPDVLGELLRGEHDGFTARWMFCFPEPISDFTLNMQPIDMDGARIALLRLRNLRMVEDGDGVARPFKCRLSPEAAATFEGWCGKRRAEASHHVGIFGEWLGKAGGLALRLALVLEYLRWSAYPSANSANSANSFPKEVSLDAVQSAIQMIDDWAIPMARRAFGVAAMSDADADACALARWLKHKGWKSFNARKLRRSAGGPSGRLSQSAPMAAACAKLEAAGLIRFVGVRADGMKGQRPQDYEVNPVLFENQSHPQAARPDQP